MSNSRQGGCSYVLSPTKLRFHHVQFWSHDLAIDVEHGKTIQSGQSFSQELLVAFKFNNIFLLDQCGSNVFTGKVQQISSR